MIQIRVSTLESFRIVVEEEYRTAADLADYIRNGQTSEPSENMRVGKAWHHVLEKPDATEFAMETVSRGKSGTPVLAKHHRSGEFYFAGQVVRAAKTMIGPGRKEVEFKKTYRTSEGPLHMVGHVDWLRGLLVQDTKTKVGTTPHAEDYEDSLQWRAYLDLTGAHELRYNLFPTLDPRDDGFVPVKPESEWVSFSLWRYEGMEADLERWMAFFLQWAKSRDLLKFLTVPD